MADRPRRWRRLLQFSLRTFLVVLTAGCIWLGFKTDQVRKQREVVQFVRSLGGEVAFDYQYQPSPFPATTGFRWWLRNRPSPSFPAATTPRSPPGPAVLRMVLGDDYFADLVLVRINEATDREVARLAGQTTIRHLSVTGVLTDEGIDSLSRLTNLESLELYGGRFTAAGLVKLLNLKRLRSLTINNTTLSDDSTRSIGRLVTLEELSLANTRLASRQIGHFKDLQKLSTLDLNGTLVGDKGLEALHGLPSLKVIDLDKTMVTVKGIKKLQEALPQAQILPTIVGNELF